MYANRFWRLASLFILMALLVSSVGVSGDAFAASSASQPQTGIIPDHIQGPFVGELVEPQVSPPARSLPISVDSGSPNGGLPRINPLRNDPDQGDRGTSASIPAVDPLIPYSMNAARTPALGLSFEGTGNPVACAGCSPPDTNGDVGPNHYIQMVNATKVAIYNKAGTLLSGPFNLGTLWSVGNCTGDAGDPIVLYDSLADRWLLSQFASPNHMCIAISQTADPTGSYFLYEFNVSSFPDYFKFGVWPDGYYMAANEATYTAYSFDRVNMLAGNAATFVKFSGETNLLMPSDVDGSTAPPANSPNLFYTFKDNSFHGGVDRLEVFAFDVDFVTPANSTFTLQDTFNITSYTYTSCGFFVLSCIPQLGTATKVDAVSEWPMFRFPYRNFGGYQALAGNFAVQRSGSGTAAIRWFELRNTGAGWTLYQEGTFDPGDGHERFMGSIAFDGVGNLALGYSVSSATMNPAIRYTIHETTDPLGTMQAEATLINGGGSQTGSTRWGDYSAMGIDPTDDCTFWYTNEYYSVNSSSNWQTRIGTFTIPSCSAATPAVDLNPASIDFGNVEVGTVAGPVTVTLTNTGGANLNVGVLGINSDFGLSADTCSNAVVAPSGTCTFDVSFQPLSTGVKNGAVTVPSDAGTSPDSVPLTGVGYIPVTTAFISIGAQDGHATESSEASGVGGSSSASGGYLQVGDGFADKQVKGFLSFDTASLPNTAVILSARIEMRFASVAGTNPYTTHGNLNVDIASWYFGASELLVPGDFQAAFSVADVASCSAVPVLSWYSCDMTSGLSALNVTGLTQFRLYFDLDDNDDLRPDYVKFASGNHPRAAYRPVLVITYFVP